MFEASYIHAQSIEIHKDNRAKGFWDNPVSDTIKQGLIASEIIEAFEGLRKNKRSFRIDVDVLAHDLKTNGSPVFPVEYAHFYERNIKDTVEAELAGTCIRCFDCIGGWLHEGHGLLHDNATPMNIEMVSVGIHARIEACLESAEPIAQSLIVEAFPEWLIRMIPGALGLQTGGELWETRGLARAITPFNSVAETLKNMCLLGVWFGIDLKTHIALEVAYNRTRPHKHV